MHMYIGTSEPGGSVCTHCMLCLHTPAVIHAVAALFGFVSVKVNK